MAIVIASVLLLVTAVMVLSTEDRRSSLVGYGLRFPRQLETEGVGAFLEGLTGLLPP